MMKFLPPEAYQSDCEAMYQAYRAKIKTLLPDARVEHVGASSIPQAVSKGDLDIFVGVDKQQLERSVSALKQLGFEEKRDTLRTHQLCMLESTNEQDVALQVVELGSEFECFLTFRDKLRENSSLVAEYNSLKRECEGLEANAYREKKSAFIEGVLSGQ